MIVTKSKLALLTGQQAKKFTNEVLRQGVMTLFRKPANGEDGGLVSPKNPLTCVRIQAPFILKGKGVCVLHHFGRIRLSVILQTVACQAPLSMRFPRQEDWSGLPFPPPGDLPDVEIESMSLMSPALAGRFFITSAAWMLLLEVYIGLPWWLSGKEST